MDRRALLLGTVPFALIGTARADNAARFMVRAEPRRPGERPAEAAGRRDRQVREQFDVDDYPDPAWTAGAV